MAEKETPNGVIQFSINADLVSKISMWVWLATLVLFTIFVYYATTHPINPTTNLDSTLLSNLAMVDVAVGVISFLSMTFFYLMKKRLLSTVFFGSVLLLIPMLVVGSLLFKAGNAPTKPQSTSVLGTSSAPTPTPTSKNTDVQNSQKRVTPKEEEVWCTGPDYKQFLTTQKKCDEFQAAWNFKPKQFPTVTPKQNNTPTPRTIYVYPTSSYTPPTYVPCKICYHYPSGDSCFDYNYLYKTQAECSAKQAEIDRNTSSIPTYTPTPTVDQAALNELTRLCNEAASAWVSFKEEFMATDYNNYSSSTEAIMALERYRQQFQSELTSAGCSNTLRL